MIQTSYFARLRHLREHDMIDRCVPICRHFQRWIPGDLRRRRYVALAPPEDLLEAYKAGWTTWDKFAAAYQREVLDRLDPLAVIEDLSAMAPEGAVLMCYCKGDDGRCHRLLVSQWLSPHTQTAEWTPPAAQPSLF